MCLAMFAFALLLMFSPFGEFFTALSRYNVHFVFIFILIGMLFLIVDFKKPMFSALACAAMLSIFLKNNSNENIILPSENKEPSVSIAHFNLANLEGDPKDLLDLINRIDADIISFQEYTPFWQNVIDEINPSIYPYQNKIIRIDPYGLAIFSKLSFIDQDTIFTKMVPTIRLGIKLGDIDVNLYSSYIAHSLDRQSALLADSQLEEISSSIHKSKRPAIMVGEFNHAYWHNKIRNFRVGNNLLNSRRNIAPTSLRVPVDHIFYSSDMECTSFEEIKNGINTKIGILGRYQFKSRKTEDELRAKYGYHRYSK